MTEYARILVVDNDAKMLRATSRLLQKVGHEVVQATTGGDGLRLAREEEPDLILLAVALPDIDGLEVCGRIKADAQLARSCVVLLSDFRTAPDDQARGLEVGADGHIARPIKNRELLARVEAMLRLKRAEDALRERTQRLGERAKELNCLFGISQLVETPGIVLDEILQGIVELMPPAWQNPEITEARIILEDREFKTDNFRETAWQQGCDITVRGDPAGRIEVYYLEERPEIDEGPFLKEERELLNAIAERLGRIVERVRAEEVLRKSEERYRAVAKLASDITYAFRVEPDGGLVREWLAGTFDRITGFSPEELAAHGGWADVIHPDDRPASQQHIQTLLSGQPHEYEFRLITRSGQVRWMRASGWPERDAASGRIIRIYGAARDITARKQAEEALRESEERFRGVFEQSQDGIVLTDERGCVINWNQTMERITGLKAEGVLGRLIWDVQFQMGLEEQKTKVWYQQLKAMILEALESGQAPWLGQLFDRKYRHPDGTRRIMQWIVFPIKTDEGFMMGSIARDVTDQVRAKEALHESERRYRNLFEQTLIGIVSSGQDGRIRAANPAVVNILGYGDQEELVGQLAETIWFDPADRSRALQLVRNLGYLPVREAKLKRKDGTPIHTLATATIDQDKDGEFSSVTAMFTDISQQKQVEAALRASEEKYRDLVEKVSDVIYTLDTGGVITYISPAIESFSGYTASEAVGRPVSQFIAPDDLQRLSHNFRQLASGKSPGPNEYRMVTKSGEVRWIRTSSQPIVVGDQVVGVRGVLTDITERVRAEEQLEDAAAAAERERLARELHDSVTQALFAACLIADTLPRVWERHPEEGRRGLEEIYRLTHGALAEMRTLLFELRPDALSRQKLDVLLRQLTDGMMARTQTSFTTKVVGDCSMPTEVRTALYRIAQEALNNITKHSQARRATVSLHNEPKRIKLHISDDGQGFDPDSVQADRLGLRIMSERAQAIGATFSIKSQPAQGTEVTVVWSGGR